MNSKIAQTHYAERMRTYYDHNKHMTTLASGSIGLVLAVFEKISKAASWKFMIPVSVSLFCLSLFMSLIAMLGFASWRLGEREPDADSVRLFIAAMATFWLGAAALGAFIWRNAMSM